MSVLHLRAKLRFSPCAGACPEAVCGAPPGRRTWRRVWRRTSRRTWSRVWCRTWSRARRRTWRAQDSAKDLAFGGPRGARPLRHAFFTTPPPPPPLSSHSWRHAEMGAQLDGSVAFGSCSWKALLGMPRKRPYVNKSQGFALRQVLGQCSRGRRCSKLEGPGPTGHRMKLVARQGACSTRPTPHLHTKLITIVLWECR